MGRGSFEPSRAAGPRRDLVVEELRQKLLQGSAALSRREMDAAAQAFRSGLDRAQAAHLPEFIDLFRTALESTDFLRGMLLIETNEPGKAIPILTPLVTRWESPQRQEGQVRLAQLFSGLGVAYLLLNDREHADPYLLRAIETEKKVGDPLALSQMEIEFSTQFEQMGYADPALQHAVAGLESGRRSGDRNVLATALLWVGSAHHALGQPGKALDHLFQALDTLAPGGDCRPPDAASFGRCLCSIGRCLQQPGAERSGARVSHARPIAFSPPGGDGLVRHPRSAAGVYRYA